MRRRVAAATLSIAALLAAAGCGGSSSPTTTGPPPPPPPPAPTATVAPPALATTAAAPPPAAKRPVIGITEANPALLAPGPREDRRVAFYRDRLAALHPAYVRVLVDWSQLQPTAGAPPNFASLTDGCMRGVQPCLPWARIRDTLEAVRALGAQPVLSIYGTPSWAATDTPGCAGRGTGTFSRMPDLTAYRAFVRALLDLGRQLNLELPYWSPWNEPNLAGFLNPQRGACDAASPTVAAGLYAEIARAAAVELLAAPGEHRLLLGEAAGIPAPRPKATGARELVDALPPDLVCQAAAWTQHAYPVRIRRQGRRIERVDPDEIAGMIAGVEQALDRKGCPAPVPVWITETGVPPTASGPCTLMGRWLERWARDPRIGAVFQYTFREDPVFPTGLADAKLEALRPAYAAWLDRGAETCPAGT